MNIPVRYLPKFLTRKDRKQQRRELKRSRAAYKKGKYVTRKKVKSFRSKKVNISLEQRKCTTSKILNWIKHWLNGQDVN